MSRFVPSLLLILLPGLPAAGAEAANSAPTETTRQLLVAGRHLAESVAGDVWPGWGGTPFEVLLVEGEDEFLVFSDRVPDGFTGIDGASGSSDLGRFAVRPRKFPPQLLATMPVFGLPPTIVVGSPQSTGRTAADWVLVLLHEHFHQLQMGSKDYFEATEALDLADGDTTGRWMLEYPFPYDDAEVGEAFSEVSVRLAALLDSGHADRDVAESFWSDYDALLESLQPADARYLRFQAWQEGVARYVELRSAQEASRRGVPAVVTKESGSDPFGQIALRLVDDLFEELRTPDLVGRRRVSFYALGAGLAMLLDRTEPGWKARYEAPRFRLSRSMAAD